MIKFIVILMVVVFVILHNKALKYYDQLWVIIEPKYCEDHHQ